MTASLAAQFVVTDDELHVLAARLGVQALPLVLDLRTRHPTETARADALGQATRSLTERGLLSAGDVDTELSAVVQSLQRPDRELAMRLVTPDGLARVTVVRHGTQCVSACRVGNDIALDTVDDGASASSAAAALLRRLPASAAAEIIPVGAPLADVSQALSDTHDSTELSDRIRALGADTRTAMTLGSALSSRLAFAEIVYYALDDDVDRISRCAGAVGIFYTKRGRIVGAPSSSPSGQLWTTLKPGSDHTIKQAIGQLVELSGYRWGDC
ncbi:ESX secretion-associated protein EspG [Mycolicibacterium porcinum]|uniref:ESX secretion-associated protein EspG n=1 Tax=Mycolicibacterium porcinum TaxID=39693 RepID=A0AAW5SXZ7_9MYCO|nr:ESX secretion-associated protein EspG [Mycolicibacterium porcinum]MCV7386775.1 ESX secretion-associated protein EspG [Mycolicibacterium porcinum]ORB36479.1 ESX secretion-associated protein EspG [Mycolicibacterium porcinum]CDO28947.1 ESX-1 secretion-associated protein EspG1 [Mycolicibacterium vulneris]